MFDFEKEIKRVKRKNKYIFYKFISSLIFVAFSMIIFIIRYNNKFLFKNIFLSILAIILIIINYTTKNNYSNLFNYFYSNLFNYFERNFYPVEYKKIFKEVFEKYYKKNEKKYLEKLRQRETSLIELYIKLLKNLNIQNEIEKEIKILEKRRLDNNVKSRK
jgi:hypothetical protein